MAANSTLTLPAGGAGGTMTFNQNAGSLTANGTFLQSATPGFSAGAFSFSGGAITGTGAAILQNVGLTITTPNTGGFRMRGTNNTLTGDVSANQTLLVQGEAGLHAAVTLTGNSSNAGTIVLDSLVNNANAQLIVPGSSTLTNTGTITVNGTVSGGGRFLRGNIANSGTVTINEDTNYDQGGATFSQNDGSLTANATFLQSTGCCGPRGAFSFSGGAITGTGAVILQNAALSATGTGTGTVIVRTTSNALTGDVGAGVTVFIRGEAFFHAILTSTSASGFTNNGSIFLDSLDSGAVARLIVNNGTLTNAGTLTTNATAMSERTISALLDNQGNFTTNTTTTLQAPNAAHTNKGLWEVAVGTLTLPLQGSSPATIANTGRLVVDAGAILAVNNGGSISNSTVGPTAGLIAGSGTIAAAVSSDATVGPGSADGTTTGILTIQGNYTQTTNGTLLIELCGTMLGTQYDQLALTGNAGLAGTLMVTNTNPTKPCYDPQPNDTFRVMTFGSHTDNFATYSLPPLSPGLTWQVTLTPTFLDLTVATGGGGGSVRSAADAASAPNIVTTSKPPSRPRPAPRHPAPEGPPLRRP